MTHRASTRLTYLAVAIGTIVLGLWLHHGGASLNADARDILGDALWAAMMTWFVSMVTPTAPLAVRGSIALAISFTVELSQQIHTPALDAVRATTFGNLVLGSGFDPRDLASYAAGVVAAVLLEWATVRSARAYRSRIERASLRD